MKTLTLIAATAIIATTTAASAFDGSREARIDARRAEQAARISANRRVGNLTLLEKWRLQSEQRRIAALERNALRDGHISASEYRAIEREQNRAGRHIFAESHDGQVAFWRRW